MCRKLAWWCVGNYTPVIPLLVMVNLGRFLGLLDNLPTWMSSRPMRDHVSETQVRQSLWLNSYLHMHLHTYTTHTHTWKLKIWLEIAWESTTHLLLCLTYLSHAFPSLCLRKDYTMEGIRTCHGCTVLLKHGKTVCCLLLSKSHPHRKLGNNCYTPLTYPYSF